MTWYKQVHMYSLTTEEWYGVWMVVKTTSLSETVNYSCIYLPTSFASFPIRYNCNKSSVYLNFRRWLWNWKLTVISDGGIEYSEPQKDFQSIALNIIYRDFVEPPRARKFLSYFWNKVYSQALQKRVILWFFFVTFQTLLPVRRITEIK